MSAERTVPVRLLHVVTVPQSFLLLQGQATYMTEHGFTVDGVSSRGPYQEVVQAKEPIQLHTVEMPRRITPLKDLVALFALVRIVRKVQPDIVHAHTPKGGLLGVIAGRLAGAPVCIYHMRGLPFMTASGFRRRLLIWSERVSCRLADRVFCVSHSLRDYALEQGLCDAQKIRTLRRGSGNGVDAVRFDPQAADVPLLRAARRRELGIPDDATVVAFVGRVVRDKGVVELATAWARLASERQNIYLLLAGPFEAGDAIPAETRDILEGHPAVRVIGEVADPRPLYAAADVVTLPSHREGFPNVPLEGAAMQLPVVSTTAPGCRDAVLDGVTGTLVAPGDANALYAALARYLDDADLRRQHGAAGRARVLADFSRPEMWAALLAQYKELLLEGGVTGAHTRVTP